MAPARKPGVKVRLWASRRAWSPSPSPAGHSSSTKALSREPWAFTSSASITRPSTPIQRMGLKLRSSCRRRAGGVVQRVSVSSTFW